jgi:hypothetical protein
MAVLSKEDYFSRLQSVVGTDNSDSAIALIEDMTDTYNDLESRAKGDGVDWEKKYKELDESWKARYKHRFFSGDVSNVPGDPEPTPEPKDVTIDDLFK